MGVCVRSRCVVVTVGVMVQVFIYTCMCKEFEFFQVYNLLKLMLRKITFTHLLSSCCFMEAMELHDKYP